MENTMLLIGKPSISRAIYTMAMLNNQMVLFLVQINFLAAEIPVDIAPRNPESFSVRLGPVSSLAKISSDVASPFGLVSKQSTLVSAPLGYSPAAIAR